MKFLKFFLPTLFASLTAHANHSATFHCHSTLQYRVADMNLPRGQTVVKEVPMLVIGQVNNLGNLTGSLSVSIGTFSKFYQGYTGSASHNMIQVSGGDSTLRFSLKYMGEDSTQNWASASYQSGSVSLRAVNEILEGPNTGNNLPVHCIFNRF